MLSAFTIFRSLVYSVPRLGKEMERNRAKDPQIRLSSGFRPVKERPSDAVADEKRLDEHLLIRLPRSLETLAM